MDSRNERLSNPKGRGAGIDEEYVANRRHVRAVVAVPTFTEPSMARLLQGLNLADTAWMVDARCATVGEGMWNDEGSTEPMYAQKRLCEQCPVKAECLEAGIAGDEWGVWGGLGQAARRKIFHERRAASA